MRHKPPTSPSRRTSRRMRSKSVFEEDEENQMANERIMMTRQAFEPMKISTPTSEATTHTVPSCLTGIAPLNEEGGCVDTKSPVFRENAKTLSTPSLGSALFCTACGCHEMFAEQSAECCMTKYGVACTEYAEVRNTRSPSGDPSDRSSSVDSSVL